MSFSDFGTIETKRIQVDEGIIAQRFGTEIRDRNLEFYAGDASHPNQRISFNVHDGSVYTSVLTLDGNGFTIDKLVTQGGDSGLEAKDGSNIMGRMQITHFTSDANPYAGRMAIALNNGLGEVDVHEAFGITPTTATFGVPRVVIRDSVSVGGAASMSTLRVHTTDLRETEVARFSHGSSSDSVRVVQRAGGDRLEIVGNVNADEIAAEVLFAGDVGSTTATISAITVGESVRFGGGWLLTTELEAERTNILFYNQSGGAGVLSVGGGGLCATDVRIESTLHSIGDALFDGGVFVSGVTTPSLSSPSTLFRARNGSVTRDDDVRAVRVVDIDCGSSTALHAPVTVTGAVHAMDAAEPVQIVSRAGLLLDDGGSSAVCLASSATGFRVTRAGTDEVFLADPRSFALSGGAVRYADEAMVVRGRVEADLLVGGRISAAAADIERGKISSLDCVDATFGGAVRVDAGAVFGACRLVGCGLAIEVRGEDDGATLASFGETAMTFDRPVWASEGMCVDGSLSVGGRIIAAAGVDASVVHAPVLRGVVRVECADAGGLLVVGDKGSDVLRVDQSGVEMAGSVGVRGGSLTLGTSATLTTVDDTLTTNVPLHVPGHVTIVGGDGASRSLLTPLGMAVSDALGVQTGSVVADSDGVCIRAGPTAPGLRVDPCGGVHVAAVGIVVGGARLEYDVEGDVLSTSSRLALSSSSASDRWFSAAGGDARLRVSADSACGGGTAVRIESESSFVDLSADGVRSGGSSSLLISSETSVVVASGGGGGPSLHVSRESGVVVSAGPLTASEVLGVRTVRASDSTIVIDASIVSVLGSLRCDADIVAPRLLASSRLIVAESTIVSSDGVDAPTVSARRIVADEISTPRIVGDDSLLLLASGEVYVSGATVRIEGEVSIGGSELVVPSQLRGSSTSLTLSSASSVSLTLDADVVSTSSPLLAPEVRTDLLVTSAIRPSSSTLVVRALELIVGVDEVDDTGFAGVRIGNGSVSTRGVEMRIDADERVVLCGGGVCVDASTGRCRVSDRSDPAATFVDSRLHIVSEPLDSSALLLEARRTNCVLRLATLEAGYAQTVEFGDAWAFGVRYDDVGESALEIVASSSSSRGGAADLSFSTSGLATFRVATAVDLGLSVGGDVQIGGGVDVDGDLRCASGRLAVGSWTDASAHPVSAFVVDTASGGSTKTVFFSSEDAGATLRVNFPTVDFPGVLMLAPDAVRSAVDVLVGGHLVREVAAPLVGTDAVNLSTLEKALADLFSSDNIFPAPVYFVPSDDVSLRSFGVGFGLSTPGGLASRTLDFLVGSASHVGTVFKRFGDGASILKLRSSDLGVEVFGELRAATAVRIGGTAYKNIIASSADGFLALNEVLMISNESATASDVRITTRLGIASTAATAPAYRLHVRDSNDDIGWMTTSGTRGRIVVETTSTSASSQSMVTCRDAKSGNVFSSGYAALSDAYVIASSTDLVSNTHFVVYRTRNEAILAGDLRLRRKDGGVSALRIEDSATSATLARFDPSGIRLLNSSIKEVVDTASGDVSVVHALGGVTRITSHKNGVTIVGDVSAASVGIGGIASFSPTDDNTALKLDATLEAKGGVRSGFVSTRELMGFNAYEDALGDYRHMGDGDAMMLSLKDDGGGNPVADITFSAFANKNGPGELVIAEGTPAMRLSQRGLAVGTHDTSDSVLHVSGDMAPQIKISNPNIGDGNGVSCVLGCTETGALTIKSDDNLVLFGDSDVECGSLRASTHVYIGAWRVGVDAITSSLTFELMNKTTGAYEVKQVFTA